MTGIEALALIKNGFILRRESWESNEKCKSINFLDKLYIHYIKPIPSSEEIDERLETLFSSEAKIQFREMTFTEFLNTVDSGEFLYDDWEIVETNTIEFTYFHDRFDEMVTNKWLTENFIEDYVVLSDTLTKIYPRALPLPLIYPHEDFNLIFEWNINNHNITLELQIQNLQAKWHDLDLETNEEHEILFDLVYEENWIEVFDKLKALLD